MAGPNASTGSKGDRQREALAAIHELHEMVTQNRVDVTQALRGAEKLGAHLDVLHPDHLQPETAREAIEKLRVVQGTRKLMKGLGQKALVITGAQERLKAFKAPEEQSRQLETANQVLDAADPQNIVRKFLEAYRERKPGLLQGFDKKLNLQQIEDALRKSLGLKANQEVPKTLEEVIALPGWGVTNLPALVYNLSEEVFSAKFRPGEALELTFPDEPLDEANFQKAFNQRRLIPLQAALHAVNQKQFLKIQTKEGLKAVSPEEINTVIRTILGISKERAIPLTAGELYQHLDPKTEKKLLEFARELIAKLRVLAEKVIDLKGGQRPTPQPSAATPAPVPAPGAPATAPLSGAATAASTPSPAAPAPVTAPSAGPAKAATTASAGPKKVEKDKRQEILRETLNTPEAKEVIDIVHALKWPGGKKQEVEDRNRAREKLFGSQAIGRTLDALKKDPAIKQILEEAKGKGLNLHRIMQSVDKAEGTQPAANADELHAKVTAVLGRMKEIIERVKRENGRAPAPAPQSGATAPAPAGAPAAPAASTSSAPTAGPNAPSGVPPEITSMPPEVINSEEFKTLVAKIKEVRKNAAALANAKGLTTNPFMQAIFVDLKKSVMTALKEARKGKPFRTEKQIKDALEHQIRILDKLLRGEPVGPAAGPAKAATPTPPPSTPSASAAPSGPAPVPATPKGAPAPAAPASPGPLPPRPAPVRPAVNPAPAANPGLRTNLNIIQTPELRAALEKATEGKPEDRDRVIQAWELYHKDAEGCPKLKIFQNKIINNLDNCVQFAAGRNPGDVLMLPRAIENLLVQLRQELNDETIKALEKEPDEKALREELVGLYSGMEDLTPKMHDLLKILEIDPSVADAGPERIHLTRVQSTIRKVLYDEIPQAINVQTAGKDLKEKIRLLGEIDDMRTIETTLTTVQGRLTSLDTVISRLPDKFKRGLTTLAPAPTRGGPAATLGGGPAPVAPVAPPVAPVGPATGPAQAVAPAAVTPGAAPRVAPRPVTVARLATDYPPKGGEIRRMPHIKNLMRNVLRDVKNYTKNFDSPICRALETILVANATHLSLTELEQFLRRPNVPTNDEVIEYQAQSEAQLRGLQQQVERQLDDTKRQITALENRLSTHRGGEEETERIHEQLDLLREGQVDAGNVTVWGRNQLEARLQNIKNALIIRTGNRQYGSVREVLAMIHIYLRQNRIESGPMNFVDIADKMEREIEGERNVTREGVWHRHIHFNFMKPTLQDTLRHLARKDPILKKIGVENMEELVKIYNDGPLVEAWIEGLGDREDQYKTAVPRLIAYLEFALRDAGSTHLNSFSQERARNLINHLRAARRNYVMDKLETEVKGKDPADQMIAYFKKLEEHNSDEAQITKKLIRRHSNWAVVKESAPLLAVGAALPFLGATLVPLIIGASVVGKGVSVAHRGVGKAIPRDWLEGEKSRTVVRGLVTTGLVAGIGALSVVAWPAALLGGALGSIPDIIRNRDILWKGTKATARAGGAVGGAAIGGARRLTRRLGHRNPPPPATT